MKRKIELLMGLCVILCAFVLARKGAVFVQSEQAKSAPVCIVVDAGHGGDDPGKIYHSPDCAPTHHYLGFYHWLRDIWGADAMIHVGTHGNLEWLPGKGNAMSNACYPDICTGDIPNIYPYWITCTGEGIQAKRRSAACLISYLSAPQVSW